ncbi:MAG TPA: hypothetical protein PLP27_00025, partial [Crocinitomicaceae bacterium]|nr:hypothetical protein [Crocinitomicaceae bacterium]
MKLHSIHKFTQTTLLLFFVLFFGATQGFSQVIAQNGMQSKESNFFSFSEQRKSSLEMWKKYNNPKFYSHPEFGVLSNSAPQGNVVEVLEKRTESSRYFINTDKPSEFVLQQAYGPIHYNKNGMWLKIENDLRPLGNNVYQSKFYLEPAGFDKNISKSYILTQHGKIYFNDWALYKKVNGKEVFIANADWSVFRAGDDGVYIANIFDGIDVEMIVLDGAIKTNFIMKKNEFGTYESLIFRDKFTANSNLKASFSDYPNQTEGGGEVAIKQNGKEILTVGEGFAYVKNADKDKQIYLSYALNENMLDVIVPFSWINANIQNNRLIIDPLVTASNTLAQASITGSGYSSTCNTASLNNSCDYNMNVTLPAGALVTNVTTDFTYIATGGCWRSEGAMRFLSGSCISPSNSGLAWFCNAASAGTCTGTGINIYPDVTSCMPAVSCSPQTIPFTLRFYRCFSSGGCSNSCIGAGSPWVVNVTAQTLEFNNPTTNIIATPTSVCQGGFVTTSTLLNYGVPNYNYAWSAPTGTPTTATGGNTQFSFNTTGTHTISVTATDACGQAVNSSVNVTVTPSTTPTFNQVGPICSGTAFTLPPTSTNSITGTWSPAINNTATTTYTFTPTAGSCAGTTTMTVTVNPQPPAPTTACYETATWNSTTCAWDVT